MRYIRQIAALLGLLMVASGCGGDASSTAENSLAAGTGEEAALSSTIPDVASTDAMAPDLESPFGFLPASVARRGYADSGYKDALNIGVGWAREGVYAFWFKVQPDLGSTEYDFSMYDRQWSQVPPGINILANIAPQTDLKDEGRLLNGSWIPTDENQYRAFVTATVERYDGDGMSDMPGLRNPIKYWQVGNEPDNMRRTGFASLERITYEAIKQVCADCKVVIGGATGRPDDYVKNFDERYAPILAELGGKYVDIFDFHWYGQATGDYRLKDSKTGADVLDHIRGTLTADGFPADMAIWIAEISSYSGAPASITPPGAPAGFKTSDPPQTERQQAGDYFKRFIYPLSRGVKKIFPAFGLMEGFRHDGGYFDYTGLIYDGEGSGDPGLGVKKLGYYTYKKMTESLAGADWSTLQLLHDGAGGDHLYLFRVMRNGEAAYIAWWDYYDEPGYAQGATKPITISGIEGGTLTVTSVVPAAAAGQAVTDYASAFTVTKAPVTDGNATVMLGEDPVIMTVWNALIEGHLCKRSHDETKSPKDRGRVAASSYEGAIPGLP